MMTIAHQTARYSDMKLSRLFSSAADIAASRRDQSGATKQRSHTRRGPGVMPHCKEHHGSNRRASEGGAK